MLVVNEAAAAAEPDALYTVKVKSAEFVLARNVGYEACVRLPAAIDAIAIPPTNPISRTTAR
jgi:hypothetical protein